jgi:pimeloyl-ACP methyl ester carboxylesterase
LDLAAFSEEVSPVAGITQAERTAAAIEVVKHGASLSNSKIVLVGHSWGGLTVLHVAEAVPELLQSIIYFAFLIPNGVPAGAVLADNVFSTALVSSLFGADLQRVGAMRIDPRTEDPALRRITKTAFYGDLPEARFDVVASLLHPDEAASTAAVPMAVSAGRYGTVDRHYVRMNEDRAIPPAAQAMMVRALDETKLGPDTSVHHMPGSHSPFFAKPTELSDLLCNIASHFSEPSKSS